jgi:DNA-binding LacI/PurR family transcriptional regulator
MALGLLAAFREAGVRVPEDVSVVGFDDIPEAAFFPPPLTTLRVDFPALGRRLLLRVDRLLAHREAGDEDEDEAEDGGALAPELVVRASTAAPR